MLVYHYRGFCFVHVSDSLKFIQTLLTSIFSKPNINSVCDGETTISIVAPQEWLCDEKSISFPKCRNVCRFVDLRQNKPHVPPILYVLSTVPVFALSTFEACNRQFKWNWLAKWPRVDWIGKCYCHLICGNSAAWNANMENGRESCSWGFMQLSNIHRIALLV